MSKTLFRGLIFIFIGILITAIVIWYNPPKQAIKLADVQLAKVDYGEVVKTVPAKGTVEPASEALVLSPTSAVLMNIENGVGSRVEKGDVIVRLDDAQIKEEIEKIEDQIEVKNNNLEKNVLNGKNIRIDLAYNVEVKKLKIISIKSELADQEQLLEVGGISPAKFEQTKQELTLAEKDLETIHVKNTIRLQQLAAEEKGLKLQIDIQQKQLNQMQELRDKMVVRAPSSGIILEVNGKEGEKVNTDKLLVRMSDLTTFKLSASIEEDKAEIIKTGREVFVLVDGVKLAGKIGSVSPTINNEKIEFDVFLDLDNHNKLRPNMSLGLLVVESRKDSVLRVKKGPVFEEKEKHRVYLKNADKALLKELETGLSGDDYFEILVGANQGDELIISGISSRVKHDEIELN